jgi:hypothetical protein
MPTYYVSEGNRVKHGGKIYDEGDAVEMEARIAKPKLEKGILTTKNWKGKAKQQPAAKKPTPPASTGGGD